MVDGQTCTLDSDFVLLPPDAAPEDELNCGIVENNIPVQFSRSGTVWRCSWFSFCAENTGVSGPNDSL